MSGSRHFFHSPRLLSALQRAERLTDGAAFSWLHQGAREFYARGGVPALQRLLGVKVLVRNSVRHGREFNVFRSDVDCAVILEDACSESRLASVLDRYNRVRSWVPSLGELEVYTEMEWRELEELRGEFEPWLSLIEGIRKIVWEEKELAIAGDAYHRNKALGSIGRVLGQLGVNARASDSGNVGALCGAVESRLGALVDSRKIGLSGTGISISSGRLLPFLGCQVGGKGTEEFKGLALSGPDLLRFLAILPGATQSFPELAPQILELRKDPEIKGAYRAVARRELLLCRSVRRVAGQGDRELMDWIRHLEEETA